MTDDRDAAAPGDAAPSRTYVGGEQDIGEYLLSSRSFEEYQVIFSISEEDLALRILDCPGGGSSFTATVNAMGGDATAVDPVYVRPPHEVAELVVAEVGRGSAWAVANSDRYRWDFYRDPAGHHRIRTDSARRFADDIVEHGDRYVAGALPGLPFADDEFALVLCSHLLFTYSDRLDRAFHLAGIREMARVGRQVRIYPLVHHSGRLDPDLVAELAGTLRDLGYRAETVRTAYEFQRGADAVMVVERDRTPRPPGSPASAEHPGGPRREDG